MGAPSVTAASGTSSWGASTTARSASRSSAMGICNAAVSESGPPDRARSTTRSPASSPNRGSFAPSTVKYANPTLSPSRTILGRPVAYQSAIHMLRTLHIRLADRGRSWPPIGNERSLSRPALAAGAALQAVKDVGQSLVALPVHEVEIDPRVGKRPAKAKD